MSPVISVDRKLYIQISSFQPMIFNRIKFLSKAVIAIYADNFKKMPLFKCSSYNIKSIFGIRGEKFKRKKKLIVITIKRLLLLNVEQFSIHLNYG